VSDFYEAQAVVLFINVGSEKNNKNSIIILIFEIFSLSGFQKQLFLMPKLNSTDDKN